MCIGERFFDRERRENGYFFVAAARSSMRGLIVFASVGQVVRIFNDDSVPHRLHTNGIPCLHGSDIAPGSSWDCETDTAYDPDVDGAIYDHNYGPGSVFWLKVSE